MKQMRILGLSRIALGWVFLWAFMDKLWGLGFATAPESAWLVGGSPTAGFLRFATRGPLAEFYQGMAGSAVVDWLFMLGLLLIGIALVLGIAMKLAVAGGALLMLMMYSAVFPPEHNPVVDDHIIYALLLVALAAGQSGDYFGVGRWWSETRLVRNYPILR